MDPRIFQHAARLRMNGLDDGAVVANLELNDVSSDDAGAYVHALDESGVSVESNSRPNAIGWLLVLVSIGITAAIAFGVGTALSGGVVVGLKIWAIPAVAAGFGFFVGTAKFLEKRGVEISYVAFDPNVTDTLRFDFDVETQND